MINNQHKTGDLFVTTLNDELNLILRESYLNFKILYINLYTLEMFITSTPIIFYTKIKIND